MHYVDAGPPDGEVVLMLHGQPTWSYLYRKMIGPVAEAGYRVIAPDLIGMGKSDKPIDPNTHTFEQQVAWNDELIDTLGLDGCTLVCQDWGSAIGLRLAGDRPDRFARIWSCAWERRETAAPGGIRTPDPARDDVRRQVRSP